LGLGNTRSDPYEKRRGTAGKPGSTTGADMRFLHCYDGATAAGLFGLQSPVFADSQRSHRPSLKGAATGVAVRCKSLQARLPTQVVFRLWLSRLGVCRCDHKEAKAPKKHRLAGLRYRERRLFQRLFAPPASPAPAST
jgi:hypothetical protein